MPSLPTSAYAHIPFCQSKCAYCDFHSVAGGDELHEQYISALCQEISNAPRFLLECLNVVSSNDASNVKNEDCRLQTVYLGGGTPSVLSVELIEKIIRRLDSTFGISPDAEISIEVNPGSVEDKKLAAYKDIGINRLSIGVQSFNDSELRFLGRAHDSRMAVDACVMAKRAGFRNFGIDLMFAIPGQSLDCLKRNLDAAITLEPTHISIYELSIEKGTKLYEQSRLGEISPCDDELSLRMFNLIIEELSSAGYEHYEVSNFARPGFRSRHNQIYWRNEPYYGFGSGASGFVNRCRYKNSENISDYINKAANNLSAISERESLDPKKFLGECLMLGLRMTDGMSIGELSRKAGLDVMKEFGGQIAALVQKGLLNCDGGVLKATQTGIVFLNDVVSEFICLEK